ncbi:uncharacterized protein LOC126990841 isoform X6 [Eriocheir sinensis]|uniref:uncharacterized protein LOC126990841 isoform X6 n=1 Tax=Eriocheir sinensis TaxID=95602 RepID=UPI0021C59022|nr:uncharacterized protein LOC126990841 isoform X6 [Eriocheir sinensis]
MEATVDVDVFETAEIVIGEKCVTFRTNVKSKEDFQRWKDLFCMQNRVCFNKYKAYSVGQRKLFRQTLKCHHGIQHKGVKKTYTGCKVLMDVQIKIVHSRSSEQIRDFPCFMMIRGNHNHPLDTAEVLNELRVSACTREMFNNYFSQGMTPGQAYRHHLLKMDLTEDLYDQANKSINPSPKSIEYMWTAWRQSEHGGLNTPSMFDAIKKYADHPELILESRYANDKFSVVLVTPFMMRAHRQLKEAGEVVFVDATSCVDQLNTAVIPFLCAGPAGAVPLAVVFTSSQDEATLTEDARPTTLLSW